MGNRTECVADTDLEKRSHIGARTRIVEEKDRNMEKKNRGVNKENGEAWANEKEGMNSNKSCKKNGETKSNRLGPRDGAQGVPGQLIRPVGEEPKGPMDLEVSP